MAEIHPVPIYPTANNNYVSTPRVVVPVNTKEIFEQQNNETNKKFEEKSFSSDIIPDASFHTYDEMYFQNLKNGLPYTEERGTACCAAIEDPRNQRQQRRLNARVNATKTNSTTFIDNYGDATTTATIIDIEDDDDDEQYEGMLYVGISHSKIPFWKKGMRKNQHMNFTLRQYLHRLYAFDPIDPGKLVAISGRFCLGMPTIQEKNEVSSHNSNNTYNNDAIIRAVRLRPLTLGRAHSCPFITFPMSMNEKTDDPSTVLIAYGVNDCSSRIAEVDKSELTRLLFPPDPDSQNPKI